MLLVWPNGKPRAAVRARVGFHFVRRCKFMVFIPHNQTFSCIFEHVFGFAPGQTGRPRCKIIRYYNNAAGSLFPPADKKNAKNMNTLSVKKLYFKDTSFANLMMHRIYNVLLYASKYDAFALEEDGRIDEQLFKEYTALNLRNAPRFTLVSTEEEADEELREHSFDLVISMPSGDSINPFEWAKKVKRENPNIPIVVLTPFSKAVSQRIANEDLSAIDYVFSWLGNADILLAIIKLIEDRMNVEEDVESVGVQVILVVEDAIHFYSSLIPRLYKYVFTQSRSFMTEALNDHEQMLRMRGRPRILLARSYEEAMGIYSKYKNNMLGVITDVSFPKDGEKDKHAGIKLAQAIREQDRYVPIIVESTEMENKAAVEAIPRATFVSKTSKNMHNEVKEKITENFGFGDFAFIDPHTRQVECRIKNLRGLHDNLCNISDASLLYHVSRNDVSRWLYSRALFPLAEYLKSVTITDGEPVDMDKLRQFILDAIVQYRRIKNRGVVAVFQRDRFDRYSNFARIGEGSMGGKGRGLAFIDAMLKRNEEQFEDLEHAQITIPKTVVLCTDNFTEFMEQNRLYPVALSDSPDDEIPATSWPPACPKTWWPTCPSSSAPSSRPSPCARPACWRTRTTSPSPASTPPTWCPTTPRATPTPCAWCVRPSRPCTPPCTTTTARPT